MSQQHFEDFCEDRARNGDGHFAIAFALMQHSREQKKIAKALESIGMGDVSGVGALEGLGIKLEEAASTLAESLREMSDSLAASAKEK